MSEGKYFKSGDLVWFAGHDFGVQEESCDLAAVIVEPYNLLRNAKIRIQKTGKTYRRIPYRYLRKIED